MKNYWFPVMLLFYCLPIMGSSIRYAPDTIPGPDFKFYLVTEPRGLFLPGDEVRFAILPEDLSQITTDSFTLAITLPLGLLLDDTFWSYQENIAYRTLPTPNGTEAYPVDITTKIAPSFTGRQLKVSGHFADFPEEQKSVLISVAEILESTIDTCFFLQDTTGGNIRTIVASRREVKARLQGPIDLSPTAPISVSHKNCKAFILKPGKKREKQKENCTALEFVLADSIANSYPTRYVPGSKKVVGILPFHSNGNKGDTLNITFKTIKGKPLSGIALTDQKEEILDAVKDAPSYTLNTVLDTATFHRTLHLRARRLLGILPLPRQYVLVDAERRPATVTLYRDNGPALQQPNGDTTVLVREVVASQDTLVHWKEISAVRYDQQTIFSRFLEIIDTSGNLPTERQMISQDTCDGLFAVDFGAKLVKKQIWVPVDTLLYQVSEDSSTIVGLRNPLGLRSGNIEVKVPLQLNVGDPETIDRLMGIAYWIGIGEPPIMEYAALAEEVPPEWAQPGVSAPLAAYGMDHPVVLPGLTSSNDQFQEEQVSFDFVGQRGKIAFASGQAYTPLIPRDSNRPNFGVLNGASLQRLNGTTYLDPETGKKVLRFYLAFANQHQINTYRLQLKIVAYYRVFESQDSWVPAINKP